MASGKKNPPRFTFEYKIDGFDYRIQLPPEFYEQFNSCSDDGREETFKRFGVCLLLLTEVFRLAIESGVDEGVILEKFESCLYEAKKQIEETEKE